MPDFRAKIELEDCTCERESAKACFIYIGDGPKAGQTVWIPKSQIDDDSEVYREGDTGSLVISEWIAEEKGLI